MAEREITLGSKNMSGALLVKVTLTREMRLRMRLAIALIHAAAYVSNGMIKVSTVKPRERKSRAKRKAVA